MVTLLPLLATLVVTAQVDQPSAEVGQEAIVQVSASGVDLSSAQVKPPHPPEGVELGPPEGPTLKRFIEVRNGIQVRTESLIWVFPLTSTRAGSFRIPPFSVTAAGESAASAPFSFKATGSFDGRRYAFVETRVDPRPRWAGEPIEVKLVAGIASPRADRLVHDETLLTAPWLEQLGPGCLPQPDEAQGPPGEIMRTPGGGMTMQPGQESRREGRFNTWSLQRTFLPTRAGSVTVGPSQFRAVIATRLEHDFLLRDRVYASQTKLASVSAPPVTIAVKPLPDAGRPDGFSGLVGRLSIAVEADPRTVKVGDSIRVRVTVSGPGNLSTTPLPRAEPAGFKRFGVTEEVDPAGGSRTLLYDLAPVSTEVEAIPPFRISFFDSATGRYALLASPPIRIKALPGGAVAALTDLPPLPPPAPEAAGSPPPGAVVSFLRGPGGLGVMAVALGLPAAVGAGLLLRRRKQSPPAEPRRLRALTRLKQALGGSRSDPGDPKAACAALVSAWAHFLADLADLPPESFLGVELEEALSPYLADAALRARAARLMSHAEQGAFGQQGEGAASSLCASALELAGVLESAFRSP